MGSHQLTPLSATEQWLLVGILAVFVAGAGILAWQGKSLDRQLERLETSSLASGERVQRPVVPGPTQKRFAAALSLLHASAQDLEALPGIGPGLAQEIVNYRTVHGFSCIEDLMKVPGIGIKRFQRIRDRLKLQ